MPDMHWIPKLSLPYSPITKIENEMKTFTERPTNFFHGTQRSIDRNVREAVRAELNAFGAKPQIEDRLLDAQAGQAAERFN
jgi:hypothetical protein